jgi:hypothetical protein
MAGEPVPLGAVQKYFVPTDRVTVRNDDIEDRGDAVQRALPRIPVGKVTLD